MHLALKVALAPVLAAQALRTRRRALVLPEADGPREGCEGAAARHLVAAPPHGVRVLMAGDSSAAGVGVDDQARAFAGHLVRSLHARLGVPVAWALHARTGLTTREVHRLLEQADPEPVDVAVVVSGVNDVTGLLSPRRALAHRAALAAWLLESGRARHVVFAPLPPIDRFPLLPEPLRGMLGADARRHDAAVAAWSRGRHDVSHAAFEVALDAASMAADGYHPGEPVYRACGEAVAAHVQRTVWRPWCDALDNRAPGASDAARG